MTGLNRHTGAALGGLDHVRQSITDILTTPIGSRVMRREYGSDVPRLIDRPMGPATALDIQAAVADALYRWEPRFRLTRCHVVAARPGRLELDLEGLFLAQRRSVTLDGIIVS